MLGGFGTTFVGFRARLRRWVLRPVLAISSLVKTMNGRTGFEARDAFERPAADEQVGKPVHPAAKLAASTEGKFIHVGEDEDMVDIPARPAPVQAAVEGILSLLILGQRRLVVERLLPGVVQLNCRPREKRFLSVAEARCSCRRTG